MAKRYPRRPNQLRAVEIIPSYLKHPEGSALVKVGDTIVVCTATVDERVKEWLRGQGRGWITAEYAMLPRANEKRGMREGQFGRWPSGRSQEIQRLIGRSLRGCIWPRRVGERMITIDCDVLQADGGTRTAAVTGGFVALAEALHGLKEKGLIKSAPLKCQLAATSVGIIGKEILLDLEDTEDSNADVDLNVAADETGRIIEVQATAEGKSYSLEQLTEMTQVALAGVQELTQLQATALEGAGIDIKRLVQRPEELNQ